MAGHPFHFWQNCNQGSINQEFHHHSIICKRFTSSFAKDETEFTIQRPNSSGIHPLEVQCHMMIVQSRSLKTQCHIDVTIVQSIIRNAMSHWCDDRQ